MDKETVKTTVHSVADKAADACNKKAASASGWKKWLWAIGAIIAGAVAWFTQGCESVTPAQVQALKAAHGAYHFFTDNECKLAKPEASVK